MLDISLLCAFSFFAGLVDAAVGGGGLIQIPALFNLMPTTAPATLFGTNKLVSVSGSIFAARGYVKQVKIPWTLVLPVVISAFVMAFVGACAVSFVPAGVMRPMVFVMLIVVAIYTFYKKDFGRIHTPIVVGFYEKCVAVVIGGAIGFYDGLFGPGTGSFLIFLFIRFFAFDFLHASAAAKFVNIATNIAALAFFVPTGHVIYKLALLMLVFNVAGALCGVALAVRKGVGFVRVLFLILVSALIIKLGLELVGKIH